jgi:hypothetical protein
MSRNIKLLAGMNVLAWIVIVPVLALALVDSPVNLADRPERPQDRLNNGVVALGHPPTRAPTRSASPPGARVGLNAIESGPGRVQSMRTSLERSADTGRSAPRVSSDAAGRESSGAGRPNGAADLRGEIGDDYAGGQAPVGRVRPNTGGAPAPGTTPTPEGPTPGTEQTPVQTEPAPENGAQQPPAEQSPPVSARPKSPEPDPPADPPQSPPDETPPPEAPTQPEQPPAEQPPAEQPPPSGTEPPPAEDPPGTMGGPSGPRHP